MGLEGEAEAGDARVGVLRYQHLGGADDMRGLGQVELARGADQPAVVGRAVDQEPGIDSDAMTADARPRDRKSVGKGQRVAGRVDIVGRRHFKKKNKTNQLSTFYTTSKH